MTTCNSSSSRSINEVHHLSLEFSTFEPTLWGTSISDRGSSCMKPHSRANTNTKEAVGTLPLRYVGLRNKITVSSKFPDVVLRITDAAQGLRVVGEKKKTQRQCLIHVSRFMLSYRIDTSGLVRNRE